jgi:hypothetical protein
MVRLWISIIVLIAAAVAFVILGCAIALEPKSVVHGAMGYVLSPALIACEPICKLGAGNSVLGAIL